MTKKLTFIHAADLHLDSPFKGLQNTPEHIFQEIKESTFHALDKLVAIAINKQVDFILIVGDLFDNEKQSLKAQIKLRRAFEELKQHEISVYLSYGNHDFISGNVHGVIYPDNVHIFPNETVSHFTFQKDGIKLANIYGFSYEKRAVMEEKAKEYKIENHEIPYHIAMLHGSVRSNTDHDVYAPFQLTDLLVENFDYWALGHIHKREVLKENPPIVYPGNIQGRNRKETGMKGCYFVELNEVGSNLTFIPVQQIVFQEIKVDLTLCQTIHDAEAEIEKAILKCNELERALIDLSLTGNSNLLQWEKSGDLDELIELINETKSHEVKWKYIYRVSTDIIGEWLEEGLETGEHFIAEVIRQAEHISIQDTLKDLFHHKKARRYLQKLEDEQMIKEEAKVLLVHELLKG